MKKNAILASLVALTVCTSSAWAYMTDDDINTLSINITNATGTLCTLQGMALFKGDFFLNDFVPEFIPPYSSSAPIILNSCLSADMLLSYNCGTGKNITFESKQNTYIFSVNVSGTVIASHNLNATYRINSETFHHSINWRIEEAEA